MYQLGNYTTIRGSEVVKIKTILEDSCSVVTDTGYVTVCPSKHLVPLSISHDVLILAGFKPVDTVTYPLHIKVSYALLMGQQEYYLQGHIYNDTGIWTFKDFTIYHFHQLQNLLSLRAPGLVLNLF